MSLSIQNLSFSMALTGPNPLFLKPKLPNLFSPQTPKPSIIRMGGGPRTYPGGVSKWQWKRMQAKKAKQLLKARLCRERQIYELRKRAELKAAVSELERPWEVVERTAPNVFSVRADEQLKVLADRFQKPGGFDMWSEKDGPQLFKTPDEFPSARFFPKGVVHSVKPYRKVDELDDGEDGFDDLGDGNNRFRKLSENAGSSSVSEISDNSSKGSSFERVGVNGRVRKQYNGGLGKERSGFRKLTENGGSGSSDSEISENSNKGSFERGGFNGRVGKQYNGGLRRKKGDRRRRFGTADTNGSGFSDSEQSFDRKQRWQNTNVRRNENRYSRGKLNESQSVYDMSLRQDGSYGFQSKSGR